VALNTIKQKKQKQALFDELKKEIGTPIIIFYIGCNHIAMLVFYLPLRSLLVTSKGNWCLTSMPYP
jgi:hypothetical protein